MKEEERKREGEIGRKEGKNMLSHVSVTRIKR